MDSLLFLTIFSLLGILFFVIGIWSSRNVTTTTDYFLAGRDLGLAAVSFTLIATQLGGNMLLGTAEWAYVYGVYGVLYSLGMSAGFLLLASGFAAKLRACNVSTTAELFEQKYGSVLLRKWASLVSIGSLVGILISIVISSKTLIAGLGIHNEAIFLLFWAFIIGYTMMGGLYAVVVTDIVQVLFIIACIGFVFMQTLFAMPTGFASFKELFNQSALFTEKISSGKIIATFLMPTLFSLIEQDLAQRFFAARTQRIAVLSALFSGIFIILFGCIPVYFGMQARLAELAIPAGGNPFIAAMEYCTSPFVFVLIICSIIAAITSTADSLLCAASSNLVQDFLAGKNTLKVSQWATLIVGIIAVVIPYIIPMQAIIDVSIASYELSVCCLLVPLVASLYTTNYTYTAAIASSAAGFAGFVLLHTYPTTLPKELITLSLSLLAYIVGQLIAAYRSR